MPLWLLLLAKSESETDALAAALTVDASQPSGHQENHRQGEKLVAARVLSLKR